MASVTEKELQMLFGLPPEKVIAYFKKKGYQITFDWHEMVESSHDKAFTVAKATRMDVLQTIRGEVDKVFTEGMTERDFIKNLTPRLQNLGWWGESSYEAGNGEQITYTQGSTHRLKTIYRTNASVGYSTGRFDAQVDNRDSQPYLMYCSMQDKSVRKAHAALDGTVKHINDPFWRNFYPPNGWGCRCYVIALSAEEAAQYGVKIDTTPTLLTEREIVLGIDKQTGEVRKSKVSIYVDENGREFMTDAGWNGSPRNRYDPDFKKYDADLVVQYDRH